MKLKVIPIGIGVLETISKRFGKGTGSRGNKKTSRDHPVYNIKIG